ncbi:MAG: hypothetical protein ABII97_02420, partial [Patescibacteria group bacterium]
MKKDYEETETSFQWEHNFDACGWVGWIKRVFPYFVSLFIFGAQKFCGKRRRLRRFLFPLNPFFSPQPP